MPLDFLPLFLTHRELDLGPIPVGIVTIGAVLLFPALSAVR